MKSIFSAARWALFLLVCASLVPTNVQAGSGMLARSGPPVVKQAGDGASEIIKIASRRARKRSRRAKRTRRSSRSQIQAAYRMRRSGRIKSRAPWKCVPARLKVVLAQVARKYGPVTINSSHRSRRKNRRVGGRSKSYHIGCRAVDFRVHGKTRGLTRFLARHPKVGGYKRYRSGFYHIDTGPKRTW